jgi:hypothetical protein
LGQIYILSIWYNHHLGLLQCRPQVEIIQILIVCQETNPGSISAWKCSLFDDAFYCMCGLLEVTWVKRGLWYIKQKDVSGWHRWPIHILHTSEKVHCSI